MDTQAPLVLFDGVCNVCNGFVNFVIDRDPAAVFRFASLQSEAGQAALLAHGRAVPSGDPDTIVLIQDGLVYERSAAVLRVVRRLRGPCRLLYLLWRAVAGARRGLRSVRAPPVRMVRAQRFVSRPNARAARPLPRRASFERVKSRSILQETLPSGRS
jgi:predicted DCC family thiol-disulfide oxidoreductase YuxK